MKTSYTFYPRHRGTTREVWKYLAEQQAKGWPGSRSIHGRLL